MTAVINAERLLSTFTDMCAIDAEPKRERAMADRLTALLGDLGFAVTEDDAGVKLGVRRAIYVISVDSLLNSQGGPSATFAVSAGFCCHSQPLMAHYQVLDQVPEGVLI